MRARWWHYAAAVVMCVCGIAVVFSRAGIVYRDPNLRSCRVYGLSDGFFYAHTYGSSAPPGLSNGWTAAREPRSVWALVGWIDYTPAADERAYYRSDWNVMVPLWTPFLLSAIVLLPRLPQRMSEYARYVEHRRAIASRRARRLEIGQGRCPACRYNISGLPAINGRRICPECGDPLVSRQDR